MRDAHQTAAMIERKDQVCDKTRVKKSTRFVSLMESMVEQRRCMGDSPGSITACSSFRFAPDCQDQLCWA